MNIGSCEIIDLKATTTSPRIAYETNDLSTNNSNLNHNTVKISHTISNHEQNGGNVSAAAAAKAINGENLEDKKRKLRLPLLNSSPNNNNNNTDHNNSAESINDSANNDSSMSFFNTLNSNEQTNKRHKAIFNNGLINLPPYLSSSLSVNETPSLNKDLIKHLDQTNNLSTPQIDKLINEYGNSMNSAMKTPGSALAVFNGNNIYFSLTPQLDMNLYTEYSQLNSNKTNDSITPGTSSIVNPNAIFPIINQVSSGSNGVINGTSINSGATSAAAVTAATVVIAPTSISNKNNNNYATLTNVQQQQHHHQNNNNNNNNSNTGNFVQIQTNTSTNQNNIYGDINNNNILTNKIMNIKDEKDFTLQTVPVHPNNYNRPTSTTTSNQKQTRLKQTNNNKQTKSASIINRHQQQQQQPVVATSVTVDTYNDSITSTTTPNSSSFNSRRDTGNSTTSSSSNLDTSFSPINFDKQETLKLEKKRERNREAARKCRTRKLEKIATLEIQVKNLTETNEAEKAKTDKLREEINIIRVKLEQHKKIHNCDLKLNI